MVKVVYKGNTCVLREREGTFVMEGTVRLCARNTFVESVMEGMA